MSEPIVTTVIPTYRRPAMLRRAIQSVLRQTFPDFRICVYDNASGDETAAVVEEFRKEDSRVEYISRPTNIGAYRNFVDGAARVETPYFSFLPDDDIVLPHFFEAALEGFRRHPEAALSVLATLHMTPHGFVRDAWIMEWREEGLLKPPKGMVSCLRHGNPGLHVMLIRRDTWKEFGGFDEATEPCGDFDFELRVAALRPIVVSRQPGGIQVLHRNSRTTGADLNWVWPPMPRIIKKFQDMGLPAAAKEEVLGRLTSMMRNGLIVRGGLPALRDGKWADAERSAELLEAECGSATTARIIRTVTAICRRLPGSCLLFHALSELRNWGKAAYNLPLRWRFRSYAKLVRVPPTETSESRTYLPQTAARLGS